MRSSDMNNPELFDFVRKKLSRLYASFKNYEGVIRFLFLTGITKFNKTSIFSELNTLTDISLSPRYGSLLGYTHEEVVEYFKDYLNWIFLIISAGFSQISVSVL